MTALIVIGCILLFFIILFGAHAFITIDVTDEFRADRAVSGYSDPHPAQKAEKV